MNYDEISKHAQSLTYRDKFRLAQLLIQWARKEEEEMAPDKRQAAKPTAPADPELVLYVAERIMKLKPTKRETVLNSIGAMFQFQGGITDADKEKLLAALIAKRHLSIGDNNRVQYPG